MTSYVYSYEPRGIIYGEDGRIDASSSSDANFLEMSRSVAGMVRKSKMSLEDDSYLTKLITFEVDLLGPDAEASFCSSERFSQEYVLPICSGFLISEDILVTAGHCIRNKKDCSSHYWVFDYTAEESELIKHDGINEENVFSCEEVLETKLDDSQDYAVIKLDRKVPNREPLKIRKEGIAEIDTPLAVIGHPSGLPLKFADGASVTSRSSRNLFLADLDTYGGNSGSPVFNADTYEVEGILIRGEQDFIFDRKKLCLRSNQVKSSAKAGEVVADISSIPFLKNL